MVQLYGVRIAGPAGLKCQIPDFRDNVPSTIENENSDYGVAKISADLRRLERRDLWAWMTRW
jgi:hypothetical protein